MTIQPRGFDFLKHVDVRLSVELGRTDMKLKDVLSLGEDSVVMLDRLTDELLDVLVNGQVIARGEMRATPTVDSVGLAAGVSLSGLRLRAIVSGAVRAVTKAPGANGEEVPVDLTLLRQQLAEIQEPAQHVADFADRSCGLKLNP